MMTNLLGRRVVVDNDADADAVIRGKVGVVVAVSESGGVFRLLVELVESGWLVTLVALDCTVSPT